MHVERRCYTGASQLQKPASSKRSLIEAKCDKVCCSVSYRPINKLLNCPVAQKYSDKFIRRYLGKTLSKKLATTAPVIRALLDCVARYKFIYVCMYVCKCDTLQHFSIGLYLLKITQIFGRSQTLLAVAYRLHTDVT